MKISLNKHTFKIDPGNNFHYWKHINVLDWEPESFKIFDYFITTHSTVLDIGAWSGVFSLYAAKTAQKVYAIDPDPICYQELNKNISINLDIKNKIQTFNIGLSHKNEKVNLYAKTAYGKSSSSILKRRRDKKNNLKIETLSLFEFLNQNEIESIDFIKMDVEGAEFIILPSVKESLIRLNYPTLYISFHYQFLNEHIYYHKIPFLIITKILMKLEMIFNFSIFKKTIQKEIANLFNAFEDYKYIYKADGAKISFSNLIKHPDLIKGTDLVFTNIEWKIKN